MLHIRYHIVDVAPVIIDAACQLANKHPLRAYDAVQLATACLANQGLLGAGKPPLTFVCADDRLISIAQIEGLLTENPNRHPYSYSAERVFSPCHPRQTTERLIPPTHNPKQAQPIALADFLARL